MYALQKYFLLKVNEDCENFEISESSVAQNQVKVLQRLLERKPYITSFTLI